MCRLRVLPTLLCFYVYLFMYRINEPGMALQDPVSDRLTIIVSKRVIVRGVLDFLTTPTVYLATTLSIISA